LGTVMEERTEKTVEMESGSEKAPSKELLMAMKTQKAPKRAMVMVPWISMGFQTVS